MVAVAALCLAAALPVQQPTVLEGVEVSRVVIDARIVDGRGRAQRALTRDSFRVEVDGRPVRLESVDWIDDAGLHAPDPFTASEGSSRADEVRGRLIVFLFQKDFQGNRMKGLMRMTQRAAELVDELSPDDRVAVLVFDSHLRLHSDFTGDRGRLRRVLDQSVLQEWPRPLEPGPAPSLAALLDARAAREAATAETGLLVLARALKTLPGAKSIVLFGWGLGRLLGGTVSMEADYGPAQEALSEARATVFALDVTDADYHSLEVGLERVAEDTGGFYVKTHLHPGVAMARLAGAMAGYYVLTFEKPPGRRGSHRVDIDLVGRKGTVLARSGYVD